MKQETKHTAVIILFCVAMAALESAVVVYLRALYYTDGFTVAFKLIDPHILLIEVAREAATLVMLWAIGFLTGKTRRERFAYFLLCFAVWDIFYYIWLKVFIDWPASFFEWDILFLIPVTWLGPVLSPVICSFTMILLATVLLRKRQVRLTARSVIALSAGSLLIFYTYVKDYTTLLLNNNLSSDYFHLFQNKKFITIATSYLPHHYNWTVFSLGEVLIIVVILELYFRSPIPKQNLSTLFKFQRQELDSKS